MIILLGLNFLIALPVIFVVLRRAPSPFVFLLVGAWSLMLGVVECVCLMALPGGHIEQDAIVLILVMNLVHGLLLAGSLVTLTMLGCRLRANPASFGQIRPIHQKIDI